MPYMDPMSIDLSDVAPRRRFPITPASVSCSQNPTSRKDVIEGTGFLINHHFPASHVYRSVSLIVVDRSVSLIVVDHILHQLGEHLMCHRVSYHELMNWLKRGSEKL